MKKTKKIKTLVAIILIVVSLLTICLVALTLNTTSHCKKLNKPNRIIVYYNNVAKNKVFEQDSEEYNKIYLSVIDAYKQPILSSFVDGTLFEDVTIIKPLNNEVNFSGIKINFVYDIPQSVKYKNKLYEKNGECFWYQNLIFDVSNINRYQYGKVAIIPPPTSNYYTSPYEGYLQYSAYSNFKRTYNIALDLF